MQARTMADGSPVGQFRMGTDSQTQCPSNVSHYNCTDYKTVKRSFSDFVLIYNDQTH